ncbi:hypothetical protein EDM22_12315 [Agromyces tardus]|uniref:Uncharacterized protein n=1 Tax=Agromyces tardus TaxID=2583849 RepID=A0A3M8A8C3_9MICO|nr:hypothetical protein [Agromyces tardus]RNB47408.1 hypothetical protein EDM22_12315 [Agromyces tardus]
MNMYLLGKMHDTRYQVLREGVSVQLINGKWRDLKKNEWVPVDAMPSHVEHLLDVNLIRRIEGSE